MGNKRVIMKKNRLVQGLLFLFLLAVSLQVVSQQHIGRQTISQFGPDASVLSPDVPPFTVPVPMAKGRSSALFLGGVGGVSFDQVARPADDFRVSSLSLSYNVRAADGKRLELRINQKPVNVLLPDWMLVPIAKYADSPYYSCYTLFGKLKDKKLEKQITEQKGRVVNYHPDLMNTLLGIRLAYIDMLVGYTFASDLPKNSMGEYLLGTGEDRPDLKANRNGAYYLSQHINRIENKYADKFRSYVISDLSQQIRFSLLNDSLVISSYPYFYCWKFKGDAQDYDMNRTAAEISSRYTKKMKELSASSGSQAAQDWLVENLIALSKNYDGNYGFYSEGTFVDLVKLSTDAEKRQFLVRYAPDSLLKISISTETYMDRQTIVPLTKYSDEFSSKPELFEAANPAVWRATVNTMRYAAFFRYVKANFPENWLAFKNQIVTLDPEPRIVTPTIMFDPRNKAIEQAILDSKKRGAW